MVHHSGELPKLNYSRFINEKLGYVYGYLANVFAEVKGITIQQFIIIHKIYRVKELLIYGELNLTEISYKLHYSSLAHLSNQFKKITALTPFFHKQIMYRRKQNLKILWQASAKFNFLIFDSEIIANLNRRFMQHNLFEY